MNRRERRDGAKKGLWTPQGAPEPSPQVRQLDDSGPKVRLIICQDCRSIDELPDFLGRPQDDILLDDLLQSAHIYQSGDTHSVALVKVAERLWNDKTVRKSLVEQLSAGGSKGLAEIDPDFYDTKSTYVEDALKCYDKHHRPKDGCIDWHDSSKRIGNPSRQGWKTGPKVFACDFCPVRSWVDKKKTEESAR